MKDIHDLAIDIKKIQYTPSSKEINAVSTIYTASE